ncbi:amino acid permease [Acinetobacter nosocomialis]|uniref:Amino acid permease n=2 Tax=Moraxellaceae TaxID=468 RepID=A0AB37CZF0_ACINO|nr:MULTISPECIES: amino acid permease [Acinetobacter]MBD8352573.1 amino acid permease [Acinetobacter nosocomialis]MBJ8495684.1 amino acid permease [Acinetobacter nosocomialis]MBJ9724963.1 amino acid permease [Acinetobacter nosocomialis]MBP1462232.1 amino acid permease [Acinetobacter nosocomialis]MBP1491271.1 amino acid permease [Acinetobacter nosocomialis]
MVHHSDEAGSPDHLQRKLSNRHLQLIAIGGAIGTGLFMGSGKTISLAGPSILVIYMLIGGMFFFLMRALGELLLTNLHYKSFVDMAYDLIGPWAGYYIGWTYWLGWVLVGIADLSAVINYLSFWLPEGASFSPMQQAMISAGCVLFVLSLNLLTVKLFGEVEFWFALIKILAIIGLIGVGGYMILTHFQAPHGDVVSISNVWSHGGIFPKGVSGFLAGFQIAVFAFIGVELIGTTAAETKDPEKNLPKAINAIPVRIILFYVLALFVVMSVTPWDHIRADKSPFVELFLNAGIPISAIIMNLVVLSSVMSSMNSGVFSTSRMLFGLSKDGQAPGILGRLSKRAVPSNGLIFSCIFIMGGAVLQYFVPNTMEAFTLASSLCVILFISVWILIMACYLRYRKTRPELHAASTFKMPGGVLMAYAVIAFFLFTLVILALEPDTLKALYVSPVWVVVLGVTYYAFYKPRMKKLGREIF